MEIIRNNKTKEDRYSKYQHLGATMVRDVTLRAVQYRTIQITNDVYSFDHIKDKYTMAYITAQGQDMRFRIDAGLPDNQQGHLLRHGQSMVLNGIVQISNFSIVRVGQGQSHIKVSFKGQITHSMCHNVAPFYYGTFDSIFQLTPQDVKSLQNNIQYPQSGDTVSLTIPQGASMVVFAYPQCIGDVTSVKYIQLFNYQVKVIFKRHSMFIFDESGKRFMYNIYVYTPQQPYPSQVHYNITL